jgi:hypothetical protein
MSSSFGAFGAGGSGAGDDEGDGDSLRIDDLFERQHKIEDARNSTYSKVLARVHKQIRTTSRMAPEAKYCYYSFPEVLVGCPMYSKAACVAYVLEKLTDNGFEAAFVHPGLLVVSWQHWIDSRMRAEIYQRTGMRVDGQGNIKARRGATKQVSFGSALMELGKGDKGGTSGAISTTKSVEEYRPLGIYEGLGLQSRLG